MAKAADDAKWIDDLAGARDSEPGADEAHPVDLAEDLTPDPDDQAGDDKPADVIDKDAGKPDEDEHHVPVAVLTEERNKLMARIGAQDQTIGQLNIKLEKLNTLQADIAAMRKAQELPPEKEIDYLEDPKGYVDQQAASTVDKLRGIEETVKQTTDELGQTHQHMDQQRQVQALQAVAASQEEEFAKTTPDYWPALEHLRTIRASQLQMAFPDATAVAIQNHIRSEEFATAAQIIQQGRNPAEYAYNFAKTLGYTPAKAPKTNEPGESAEELADRKDAARGLGGSGSPDSELDSLLSLPQDEFDQAMSEVFG